MKKLNVLGLLVVFSSIFFHSCEPWEDDSYHEGNGNNNGGAPTLLLKEVKTTTGDVQGIATYTYDNNNRVKEVKTIANLLFMNTYSQTVNTYNGNNSNSVTTQYADGVPQMTTTVNSTLNGNNITSVIEMAMDGEVMTTMNYLMTFSQPCGITSTNVTMTAMGMPPMSYVVTNEYFDNNCSYKEYIDGTLNSTITMDDKKSPYTTPENYSTGIYAHNPVKFENADGSVETIAYTYNADGFPLTAVHTFSNSNTTSYTEEFTYY